MSRMIERNLALIRKLEAETRKLLESLDQLNPEQSTLVKGAELVTSQLWG